jgi:hypothetical protein
LRWTETVDESKSIARFNGFHIIIAARGTYAAARNGSHHSLSASSCSVTCHFANPAGLNKFCARETDLT